MNDSRRRNESISIAPAILNRRTAIENDVNPREDARPSDASSPIRRHIPHAIIFLMYGLLFPYHTPLGEMHSSHVCIIAFRDMMRIPWAIAIISGGGGCAKSSDYNNVESRVVMHIAVNDACELQFGRCTTSISFKIPRD